jgi:hypothetical protein
MTRENKLTPNVRLKMSSRQSDEPVSPPRNLSAFELERTWKSKKKRRTRELVIAITAGEGRRANIWTGF